MKRKPHTRILRSPRAYLVRSVISVMCALAFIVVTMVHGVHGVHGANSSPVDSIAVVKMTDASQSAPDISKGLSGTVVHCHGCVMVALAEGEPSVIFLRVAIPDIERLS